MARYEFGDNIGSTARLRAGSSAVVRDGAGRILLTRRTDNGRWCLPGGALDPGESMAECCVREVFEETGLHVRVVRLLGLHSDPNFVVVYDDGNRWQIVTANFLTEVTGGTLGLSDETTAAGFFSRDEIATMDLIEPHRIRIATLDDNPAVYFD